MPNETLSAARESDQGLIDTLIAMKGQELQIVTRSLVYLNEVYRRKLDLKIGQNSLYSFVEKVLGYETDMAYLRIRAAEVLRFAPKFEEYLREGRISMSALKQAQVAFRAEDIRLKNEGEDSLTLTEKTVVLNQLLGTSTRKAARILAERFSLLDKEKDRERVRPISGGRFVLQIVLTEEEYDNLQRLKEMTAHTNPEGRNGVVIGRAIRQTLKNEEAKRKQNGTEPKRDAKAPKKPAEPPVESPGGQAKTQQNEALVFGAQRNTRRQISLKKKREVYSRAADQCQYVSPEGVRCQSRYGTQIEHSLPIAFGGTNELDNLEILCRAHNGYRAWAVGLQPPSSVQGRFSDLPPSN